MIANWFMTLLHARMGSVHCFLLVRTATDTSLQTAAALGNSARCLIIVHTGRCNESRVCVVAIARRTAG
jgi:hypothetical protein